ncbi:MAG: response regulator transcription factor [Bacteroidetes bacterium]|nr:response regulator transcription factor [Bacteroidota bacterium]
MTSNRILIALADDHVLLRNALKELINTFGNFKVIFEADNGKQLIDKIESTGMQPNICVLDVSMPVMDGYATQVAIRRRWPEIKTLILSQYDNEFTIIKLLKEGANGYLLKSADPGEFRTALESLAKHGYYHPEFIAGNMKKYDPDSKENLEKKLTKNEMIFLGLCCGDLTYKDIGEKMGVSARTVDGYRDSLFKKLEIRSRSGLVMYALTAGIVPITTLPDDKSSAKGTN